MISATNARRGGFTLLEILTALAIIALLMGAVVPFLAPVADPGGEVTEEIRALARSARASAIGAGEARRLVVRERGLESVGGAVVEVPAEWTIEIRRFSESRFRKPRRGEAWEFNAAGICEPIALRISGPGIDTTMEFDPLTALEPPHEP
jgi:prepilin-type N-terminal cleavage/methylation domain-containing protein